MLMMFTQELRDIPIEKACPYNEHDLLVILSPLVALSLEHIEDYEGNFFSIKNFMDAKPEIFATLDFYKRMEDFGLIMDTRIERFFKTKKCDYIFFDAEEQRGITDMLRSFQLHCIVKVHLRNEESESFKEVDFDKLKGGEYLKVKSFLDILDVKYVLKPTRYRSLKVRAQTNIKRSQENIKNKIDMAARQKEMKEMKVMYERYPELKDIKSASEFEKLYKSYAKRYHPDLNPEAGGRFQEINQDFNRMREMSWLKTLEQRQHEVEQKTQTIKKKREKSSFFKFYIEKVR